MSVQCKCCAGTGFYYQDMVCVRCNGKGVLTEKRIKRLMESYYPRKLAEGAISRDVFVRYIEELREMLAAIGAKPVDLDIERAAKVVPLDAAMCAKHGVTHSTTMLEMKQKFPSIFVEEF